MWQISILCCRIMQSLIVKHRLIVKNPTKCPWKNAPEQLSQTSDPAFSICKNLESMATAKGKGNSHHLMQIIAIIFTLEWFWQSVNSREIMDGEILTSTIFETCFCFAKDCFLFETAFVEIAFDETTFIWDCFCCRLL